ncbi:MAG: preprotein translocase subunit TatC [Archangium gephyra]|uniref:Sec-independent protein translocase protein TatC n=1 Tax=Archangium gephyra TaxID=48 RepID=A0A2W5TL80_9BACT|nr:MAG: preprotein translocase subunit TatC [Archangium gephyra]
MSLMEHLGELRTRLMRVTIAVLILGFASLIFAREIYGLLMRPVLLSLPPDAASLVYTSAIEEINVLMKIGLYAGVFMSTPVLLWQIWGFVAPGLYENERKLAGPFIFFGTLAFVAGALFCYFVLLPQMFTFLLQKEDTTALNRRLAVARLHEEDSIRSLRLGDFERAAAWARLASGDMKAPGEGQTTESAFGLTLTLVPKTDVDVGSRLQGLGRIIDALHDALGPKASPVLLQVSDKRAEAANAWGNREFDKANAILDEAAQLMSGVAPERTGELAAVWELERLVSTAQARTESLNWTKPMLSMNEQLTLVLVLELAFGVIFELPLVMAVLGLVGLVSSSFLFKYQRHAFVVCLIVAAIITPTGDAVNLALMAGPMLLCYELGVLLVWIVEKRRAKREAAEGTPPAQ